MGGAAAFFVLRLPQPLRHRVGGRSQAAPDALDVGTNFGTTTWRIDMLTVKHLHQEEEHGPNPPGKDLTIPVLNLGLLVVYVALNILVIVLAAVAWSAVPVQA